MVAVADSEHGLDPGSAISFAAPAGRRSIELNLISVGHKLRAWKGVQADNTLEDMSAIDRYLASPSKCELGTHDLCSMLRFEEDAIVQPEQQEGVPSSKAFIMERAVDNARWAGLEAETRNAAVPLPAQIRDDFVATSKLLTQPPGPSSATRSISRAALSIRSDAGADTPERGMSVTPSRKGKEKPNTPRIAPIILPGTTMVSSALHLIAAPVKVGGKDKETAPLAAARANANNITLGSHIISLQKETARTALAQVNDSRRLAGEFSSLAALHAETTVTVADLAVEVKALAAAVGVATFDHTVIGAPHDLVAVSRSVSHLEKATRAEFQTSQEDQAAMTNAILRMGQQMELTESKWAPFERDLLAIRATLASLETQLATAAIAAASTATKGAAASGTSVTPVHPPIVSSLPPYHATQVSRAPQYAPPRTNTSMRGRGRGSGPDTLATRTAGRGGLKRPTPESFSAPPPPKRGPAAPGGAKRRLMFPVLLLMSPVNNKVAVSPQELFARYARRALPAFPLGDTFVDFHKGSRGTLSIGWSTHAEASAFIDAWQSHGEEGLRHVEVRWCPTMLAHGPSMDADEELQFLAGGREDFW